ncbi:MAG: hypothetical protein IBJ10_05075 [Phycisphaerales bacterium]|nr:hypothetical protein [Phycisphaerales bacterium]
MGRFVLPISTSRLMMTQWSGVFGVFLVGLAQQIHDFKAAGDGWFGAVTTVLAIVGGGYAFVTAIAAIALALPGVTGRRERRLRLGAVLSMTPFVIIAGLQLAVFVAAFFPEKKYEDGARPLVLPMQSRTL